MKKKNYNRRWRISIRKKVCCEQGEFMRKNTILIVDDLKFNRMSFADILKEKYDIIEAENGQIALERLRIHLESITAIILDIVMPVMDGFEFMEEYNKHAEYKNIPVVVATTQEDPEVEKRCLELGVWDFIPKKFHPEIIWFRVTNAINRSRQHLLQFDPLTGVYNRQMFYQETRDMLDRYPEQEFAFIRFDIDRFKTINAFYGAKEGDRLLKYIADVIKQTLKSCDQYTYGRFNADIFAICVSIQQPGDVLELAKEIRTKVKEYTGLHCYLETSAGCYLIKDREMEVPAIYELAVIASKKCKGQYNYHEVIYSNEMGEEMLREQTIINEMDEALENEEFVVYFQPKYELENYTPCGAEALVRWKKSDGTMISPGEFIPIFEKNGFVIKLDFYVWEQVCRFIRRKLDEGFKLKPISVNVSRVHLYNPKFLESLFNLVEKYRIPPQYIQLELTESVFSDTQNEILEAVSFLHKAGFTLLMDDFGSNYSSLNVLKDIKMDVLKIDMKFLYKGNNDRGEKILEAVIQMADSLKMPVIAEGVEEKKQMEMLKRLGCNYIQGYYFAKPMPMEEYEKLVEQDQ